MMCVANADTYTHTHTERERERGRGIGFDSGFAGTSTICQPTMVLDEAVSNSVCWLVEGASGYFGLVLVEVGLLCLGALRYKLHRIWRVIHCHQEFFWDTLAKLCISLVIRLDIKVIRKMPVILHYSRSHFAPRQGSRSFHVRPKR
jgi:hypothetical protein